MNGPQKPKYKNTLMKLVPSDVPFFCPPTVPKIARITPTLVRLFGIFLYKLLIFAGADYTNPLVVFFIR